MSSKLLYTLKDENPNLHKQIGCINGFFQIFDRHQFLTGRHVNKGQKKIPPFPGQGGNHGAEPSSALQKASLQGRSVKKVAKEKQRASTESSRTSFSSSSCSSSFSSLECNRQSKSSETPSLQSKSQPINLQDVVKVSGYRSVKTVTKEEAQNRIFKHVDSPRPLQLQKATKQRNSVLTESFQGANTPWQAPWKCKEEKDRLLRTRDAPRFSFDGRVSRDMSTPLKIKELPRLSLDSRKSNMISNPQQELGSHKGQSSVVAKLMGLEAFPGDISSEDQTGLIKSSPLKQIQSISRSTRRSEESKRNHVSGSPQSSHKVSISPKKRNADSVTKSNPSSKIPIEPAPWRRHFQVPGLSASVYGEIEKRLADTEFKKSGKDLRALKRILEAMQKSAEMSESRKHNQGTNLASQTSSNGSLDQSFTSTKHPAQRGNPCSLHSADIRAQTSRSMQTLKTAIHITRENTTSSGKSSRSPRLQKKNGPEKQSCIATKSCDSNMTRRQLSGQVTESGSPGTKQKPLKDTSSNKRDVRKHGNAICKQTESSTFLASHIETEATSTSSYGQKQKNLEFNLNANRVVAEPAGASLEQPSPISVLNATFYRDESPSPVKKVTNIFKDDEARNSDAAEWTKLEMNQLWTSTSKLRSESDHNIHHLGQDESINYIAVLPEDSNLEHRYIYKIVLASGLLRDLESGMAAITFHPSNSPINPKVFHAVEQSIASVGLSRNISHENSVKKIQRKLIFDAVNETLRHKLVPKGCSKQWFSPNNIAGRRLKGQQLLKEVCSEIDQLQANKSSCRSDDEDDSLTSSLWEDLMPQSTEWSDYPIEISELVVDIDRLIFRDLINEVVNGETASLQTRPGGYRRQLFY